MTAPRPADLPDFERPPLVETVFSVQFESIAGWTSAHAGWFATRLGSDFSTMEEYPPLAHMIEWLGPTPTPAVQVGLSDRPPANRIWILNRAKDQLVQVQADRLVRNWRDLGGVSPYPRYEVLRDAFRADIDAFGGFLSERGLGELQADQCELTYINHIETGEGGHAAALGRILLGDMGWPRRGFLPRPLDAGINARFEMRAGEDQGAALGRLYLSAQPAWRRADSAPILILTLTARGAPMGADTEGVTRFLDLGRDYIVKGFKDCTTAAMHKEWGLKHG